MSSEVSFGSSSMHKSYCKACNKYFSSSYSLKRHNKAKHSSKRMETVDMDTSSDVSDKGSDTESTNPSSEDSEAEEHSDPDCNDHDEIIAQYLINEAKEDEEKDELQCVRELFNLNYHFRKSNLYKVIQDGRSHFQREFMLMGRNEAISKAIETRSTFIRKLLDKFEEHEDDSESDNNEEHIN